MIGRWILARTGCSTRYLFVDLSITWQKIVSKPKKWRKGGGEQKNKEETLFLFLPSLPPFIPIFALVPFSPTNSRLNAGYVGL